MNFLNLLTIEKHVAGIEISDSVVRIAFFRPTKPKKVSGKKITPQEILKEAEEVIGIKTEATPEDLVLVEEHIGENIIADGVVVDEELLAKTLKSIWTKANLGTTYAIVAIPDDKIYSRIFSFPKSVTDTRLTEAMRLAIGFQLPTKTSEVYLDWERTEGTKYTNEIFLSTIPRTVAQSYMNALDKAGIQVLALESQLPAIARALKLPQGETVVFSNKTPDGITIFAIKDGLLRFSRTLPDRFVPENKIAEEITKIKTALATETKNPVSEQDLAQAEIKDEYASRRELTEPKSKWLPALGAAIRGQIPEGEDNLVSLLPIGTEEAYAYQKATTFIILMRNVIIGISLFFITAYFAVYLFMMTLSENTAERVSSLSRVGAPVQLAEKEQLINSVNSATEAGSMFLSQTPLWSNVIQDVLSTVISGISVTAFSAPSLTSIMTLTGVATNRTVLNDYKKSVQDSPLFTEIDLPLNNLEQKGEIPFSISFRLKNPGALYYSSSQPQ